MQEDFMVAPKCVFEMFICELEGAYISIINTSEHP